MKRSVFDTTPIPNDPNIAPVDPPTDDRSLCQRLVDATAIYSPKHTEWIPNWRDSRAYQHLEQATPDQWAWEFLRRNRVFQKECDFPPHQDEKLAAGQFLTRNPRQWGLDAWKHYNEPFRPARVSELRRKLQQTPIWAITKPAHIRDLTEPGRPYGMDGRYTIPVAPRHFVVAAFDISEEGFDETRLELQCEYLKSIVRQAMGRANPDGNPVLPSWNPEPENLSVYLRVSDALACPSKPSRSDIGAVLHADGLVLRDAKTNSPTNSALSNAVEYPMEATYKLIYQKAYLRLLIPAKSRKPK